MNVDKVFGQAFLSVTGHIIFTKGALLGRSKLNLEKENKKVDEYYMSNVYLS